MMWRGGLFAALVAASGAQALDLPATARLTADRLSPLDRYSAPIAAFDGSGIPTRDIEGRVERRAFQIPGVDATVLQVINPLRSQLEAQGFEAVFDCAADQCGGFDFRFGTDVLPAPAMFVSLRDYHFLTLQKGPDDQPDALVTILASKSREAAYVQIIEALAGEEHVTVTAPELVATTNRAPTPSNTAAVATDDRDLIAAGALVLEDLTFESGARALSEGTYASLQELADYLKANPGLNVALVGHTDSVGALNRNIAISKERASSVRQRLIDVYGIAPGRLAAEGMGYLAPRASNLTEEGRTQNRRVEVIVLSTE